MTERAEILNCENSPLVSIVHEPEIIGTTGLIIIVAGGPQYRVGAHRQFVLLARRLAEQGILVIRFDHRGTGDSGGSYRGFQDMNPDIRCAVDYLSGIYPELQHIVLWGECESASAAAYYAHTDERISGIFMVNPWVRTEAGLAKTYLRHHYRARLRDPEFWKRVRSGQFSISESSASIVDLVRQVILSKFGTANSADDITKDSQPEPPLTERLERSLLNFDKDVFVLTSGRDHIAQEFKDFAHSSKTLRRHLDSKHVQLYEVADSDHTFSRPEWREDLFNQTERWLTNNKNFNPGANMQSAEKDSNEDYRDSHLNRGESYDEFLASTPIDAYIDKWESIRLKEILPKLFPDGKARRYLDFACGTGRITKVVENYAMESVGVDISESMLKKAQENTSSTEFIHADLTQEDPGLDEFELVTSFRFFGNAQDELRTSALSAINRHVGIGGYLIINNHRNPRAIRTLLHGLTGGKHELDLTDRKISDMLVAHGFEVVLKRTVGFWMFRDSISSNVRLDSKLSGFFESLFKFGVFAPLSQDTVLVSRKVRHL